MLQIRATSPGAVELVFRIRTGLICVSRTGKRDLSGLLNDGVNSLARSVGFTLLASVCSDFLNGV
jgi:hypothetical protein